MAISFAEELLAEEFLKLGIIFQNGVFTFIDTLWDDLRVPMNSLSKGGIKDPGFAKFLDDGSGSTGVFTYLFDKAAPEEVFFAAQLSHKWKLGTSVHPHVHWSPVASGTTGQKVSWGLEYTVSAFGGVFGNTTIIYGDESVPNNNVVAKTHYITGLPEIDMSTINSLSPMLLCRLFRDATGAGGTDNLDGDAALLEFDFHFEIDTIGSSAEYTKED